MNAIEAAADLLVACRQRQLILDHLEHAEHEVDRAGIAELIVPGDHFLAVLTATQRKDELQQLLSEVTTAIGQAVMESLLNPPPVKDEIAVLPRRARP